MMKMRVNRRYAQYARSLKKEWMHRRSLHSSQRSPCCYSRTDHYPSLPYVLVVKCNVHSFRSIIELESVVAFITVDLFSTTIAVDGKVLCEIRFLSVLHVEIGICQCRIKSLRSFFFSFMLISTY